MKIRFKNNVITVVALLASSMMTGHSVMADNLELIKPSELNVAFNGDMPGTGLKDGHLIGFDGEIMQAIADNLGLKVVPHLMEWAAEIQSVKTGRVDVMHGMMGWSQERTKVINITDPIYYGGPNITQRKATNWSTIQDLENRTLGTIQGFSWVDEIKAIKGSTLRLYDTSDAAVRDLLAGRIDALFADPPLIQYAISKNPDWDIHAIPLKQNFDKAYPILTTKYNVVFGLNKNAPELLKAFNEQIAKIWSECKNRDIAKKYGLGDPSWFEPGAQNVRAGVDRPQDWQQPTLPEKCKG